MGGGAKSYYLSPREALLRIAYQKDGADTSASSRVYKAKLFDGVSFPKGLYYEDLATIFRLILNSGRIVATDEYLYGYRMREGSIMHTTYSPKMLSCIPATRLFFAGVTEKFPDLAAAASSRAFSMNRSVYLNLPSDRKSELMQLWDEMMKYRRAVIFDSRARKRERIAAVLSYMGAGLFHLLLSWLYRKQQAMKENDLKKG